MVDSYVFTVDPPLAIFSSGQSSFPAIEADNTCICMFFIVGLKQYCQVKAIFWPAPPPIRRPRVMSMTSEYWIVLVIRRNFYEKWHISCFLAPIIFINLEYESSIRDGVWTQECFYEFRSSSWKNSAFSHIGIHVSRVSNRRQVVSPFLLILFYFIFERRQEKWLQMRIDIRNGQLY